MDLKPFVKKTVLPGEPLTAQAWNDVVDGIDGAYQFLQATMHTVRVHITTTGLDLSLVRVTATRDGGAPVEGVPPIGGGTDFVISKLEAGAWTVNVEAPGFQLATQPVNVADSGETALEVALQPIGPFMPDLFGLSFADAAAALAAAGAPLTRVLDFTGRDIPPSAAGQDNASAPVVVQWPAAGDPIPSGSGAQVVIAVPIQVEAAIEVPALAGLTQQEIQKALEAIGLTLGKVTVLQKQPTP